MHAAHRRANPAEGSASAAKAKQGGALVPTPVALQAFLDEWLPAAPRDERLVLREALGGPELSAAVSSRVEC